MSSVCADQFCEAETDGLISPLMTGWYELDGETYCPLHGPIEAYQRKMARIRADRKRYFEAKALAARENLAKQGMTTEEYARWNKFQSDLVNFHKKHGKLAPEGLRLLNPHQWLFRVTKYGDIDVEGEVQHLENIKKVRQKIVADLLRGQGGVQ